jgi:hypothetical protein
MSVMAGEGASCAWSLPAAKKANKDITSGRKTVECLNLGTFIVYSPLFDPEAFHTENYTEITQQCGCLYYKQKSPREEDISARGVLFY